MQVRPSLLIALLNSLPNYSCMDCSLYFCPLWVAKCIAKHLLNRTNTNIGFLAGGLVIVYIVACIFFYSVR